HEEARSLLLDEPLLVALRVFVSSWAHFSVRSHCLRGAPWCGQRAAPFPDVRFVLVPEMLQRRLDRRDGGVAERAQGLAGDVPRDAREQIEVAHLPFAALDPPQDLVQP